MDDAEFLLHFARNTVFEPAAAGAVGSLEDRGFKDLAELKEYQLSCYVCYFCRQAYPREILQAGAERMICTFPGGCWETNPGLSRGFGAWKIGLSLPPQADTTPS